ncbi:hypothetical protein DEJ46_20160 [Streptomyces venezuelae]|uniref:Uncharacterized protein n=1 Tax=Streptomyces venezuelae TaxID=54571 RepID=A0A5P2AUC5_STRVZ|nr:hypothetical protein DEJ46_20160 [Streptomyces venezuelae]
MWGAAAGRVAGAISVSTSSSSRTASSSSTTSSEASYEPESVAVLVRDGPGEGAVALGGTVAVSVRPGRGRPSPAGRPAREAEPLGAGASVGAALGAVEEGEAVPVGAGAGGAGVPGVPGPPVRPGEAGPDPDPDPLPVPVPVPAAGEDGVGGEPEGVVAEEAVAVVGGAEGPAGVVGGGGAGDVVGATVRGPAGVSAVCPRGAADRANAQANVQVSAGPRARARALRSAGVTG